MTKKDLKLTVPENVANQLRVKAGDQVRLRVRNFDVQLQSDHSEVSLYQRIGFWWFVIPALLCSILFNVFYWIRDQNLIQLNGETSIGTDVIFSGTIVGTLLFTIFFIRGRRQQTNVFSKNIYWRNFPAIIASFAVILGVALIGFFWLLSSIFAGAAFDRLTATILVFVFEVIVNYVMILAAFSMSPSALVRLFTALIAGGVLISMAANGQRRWWQHNFSFLGTDLASQGWQFNLTLIVSAFLLVTLVDYIFVSLHQVYPHSWRLNVLRAMLTFLAVDVGAVGLFPNNHEYHWLHDQIAGLLIYIIIALIVMLRWLLPHMTKEFLWISYGVGLILVAADFLFDVVGYLSLTAFEIIGFVLVFVWVMMLLQILQELVDRGTRIFEETLVAEEDE
ncbi:DUF998 domain-containing protein [uncultured Secundilactobacillus sp.]|uniref:DUF998 domain-containing protein n=1 Tax=uncultured Secundilactobacillus sp. TaxID=2813935 RepID=UPI00259990A1|nr:DUF998 domain-containing protein [uncultured Secundilactobacillus sp.]